MFLLLRYNKIILKFKITVYMFACSCAVDSHIKMDDCGQWYGELWSGRVDRVKTFK